MAVRMLYGWRGYYFYMIQVREDSRFVVEKLNIINVESARATRISDFNRGLLGGRVRWYGQFDFLAIGLHHTVGLRVHLAVTPRCYKDVNPL